MPAHDLVPIRSGLLLDSIVKAQTTIFLFYLPHRHFDFFPQVFGGVFPG